MMSMMENIKQQLQQMNAKMDNITSLLHVTGQEAEVTGDPVKFPLTSVEEVEVFEERITNPSNLQLKKSVVSFLFY